MRNRFFIKSNYKTLATITPKRIYCDDITHTCNTLLDFLSLNLNIYLVIKQCYVLY